MEHFKSLYKINGSTLSPKNSKRKIVNEMRATKRSQLYSSTRNLSPSPSPNKLIEVTEEQKENINPSSPVKQDVATPKKGSKTETIFTKETATEKQSRQKAYLMRYLAWKAEKVKKTQLTNQKDKKAPFVVPCKRAAAGAAMAESKATIKKSIAPANHVFVPPANLKEVTLEAVNANTFRCTTGAQQTLFQFVDTPKKQNVVSKLTSSKHVLGKSVPVSKPFIPKQTASSVPKLTQKPAAPFKQPIGTISKKQALPVASETKIEPPLKKIPTTDPKPTTSIKKAPLPAKVVPTAGISSKKTPISAKPDPSKKLPLSEKTPKVNPVVSKKTASAVQPKLETAIKPGKTPIRPPPIKLPPKSTEYPRTLPRTTKMPTSTATTVRQPPKVIKKTWETKTTSVPTKAGNIKSGAPPLKRPTFKAPKKATSSISKAFHTIKQNNPNTLAVISNPVPETPTEGCNANSLLNFVTSTRRKSSIKDRKADIMFNELADTISPVEDVSTTLPRSNKKPKDEKKFNFIRYSVIESDNGPPGEPEKLEKDEDEVEANQGTPKQNGEKPTNYMSPYVSVSRGKVSVKVEREKRNSIYMTPECNPDADTASTILSRTLATVRYYRKQLADEIARLNDQCAIWEKYKHDNAALIEDGGIDMINVTIGQTNLLTTKKLKQFGSLIDRCENGVLGKKSENAGDGEGAKPILPEDLEGFWSMVGLQIENVDKRFANLERWKANNWSDPDDLPPKSNSNNGNVKKVKKRKPVTATARPSGALLKMLKAAHAGFVNKKSSNNLDEDVILTPSKRKVIIQDRRSRSAAATVITVTTPVHIRKSDSSRTQDPNESPKMIPNFNAFRKSMNLLKTALANEQDRKSPKMEGITPLENSFHSYKPILKTPASKRKQKSVAFNSPRIKFTIDNELNESESSPSEMSEDLRTYKLRNRRVVLRDSSEFVIPK